MESKQDVEETGEVMDVDQPEVNKVSGEDMKSDGISEAVVNGSCKIEDMETQVLIDPGNSTVTADVSKSPLTVATSGKTNADQSENVANANEMITDVVQPNESPTLNDSSAVPVTNSKGGEEVEILTAAKEGPVNVVSTAVMNMMNEKSQQPQPNHEKLIHYLAAQNQKNCDEVEAAALDFIANEIHHPVVSCFRELNKHDLDAIFNDENQVKFATQSSLLEQGIMCIALLDYIATSIKNPLYANNCSWKTTSVQIKVKKIFSELLRVFRSWSEKEPANFKSGKTIILRFLNGLTPFFRALHFDKIFTAKISKLDKIGVRARKNPAKPIDRSALIEVLENGDTKKNVDVLNSDPNFKKHDFVDFIKSLPSKKTSAKTAPIFLKNSGIKSKYFSSSSKQQANGQNKSPTTASTTPVNSACKPKAESAFKRPAADELLNISIKKFCVAKSVESQPKPAEPEADTEVTIISEEPNTKPKPGSGDAVTSSSPPKEKVNAFMFLMNRSKELAKADKLKKNAKSSPVPVKVAVGQH